MGLVISFNSTSPRSCLALWGDECACASPGLSSSDGDGGDGGGDDDAGNADDSECDVRWDGGDVRWDSGDVRWYGGGDWWWCRDDAASEAGIQYGNMFRDDSNVQWVWINPR